MSNLVILRLDPRTRKRLRKLAKAARRSRTELVAEAVRRYLDINEWQVAAIQAGVEEANSGGLIDHVELRAKWRKELARRTNSP